MNQPRPAYLDPDTRSGAIEGLVRIFVHRRPSLFDDVSSLTEPPGPEEYERASGHVDEFVLGQWRHLALDIVPSTEELQKALRVVLSSRIVGLLSKGPQPASAVVALAPSAKLDKQIRGALWALADKGVVNMTWDCRWALCETLSSPSAA